MKSLSIKDYPCVLSFPLHHPLQIGLLNLQFLKVDDPMAIQVSNEEIFLHQLQKTSQMP